MELAFVVNAGSLGLSIIQHEVAVGEGCRCGGDGESSHVSDILIDAVVALLVPSDRGNEKGACSNLDHAAALLINNKAWVLGIELVRVGVHCKFFFFLLLLFNI